MMTTIVHAAVPALLTGSNNVSCSSVRSAYRARGLPDRDVPQSQLPISGKLFFLLFFPLKHWGLGSALKTRGGRRRKSTFFFLLGGCLTACIATSVLADGQGMSKWVFTPSIFFQVETSLKQGKHDFLWTCSCFSETVGQFIEWSCVCVCTVIWVVTLPNV